MQQSCLNKLVFAPHFKKIVMACGGPKVLTLGPPHALILWLWVSKGLLPIKYSATTNTLCVSLSIRGSKAFTALGVKSDHPQLLWILPDLKQWCPVPYLCCLNQHERGGTLYSDIPLVSPLTQNTNKKHIK